MKINSDMHSRLNAQKMGVQTRRSPQQRETVQAASLALPEPSLHGVTNAMAIMQKAQLIVQRALTVSTRLQNIALDRIANDGTQMEQLGSDIQTIQSSLEEYRSGPSNGNADSAIRPKELQDDVNRLARMTETGNIDRTQINGIYAAMQERSYAIDREISNVQRQYGINPSTDAEETAERIRSNPSGALQAQGSIHAEAVTHLTE
ncbi:MAG: hypothetical protein ACOC2H_02270 [Spirochaetota bacterium]